MSGLFRWAVYRAPSGAFYALPAHSEYLRWAAIRAANARKWSGGRYYRDLPAGVLVAHV